MGKRRTNDLIELTLDVSDPESSVEFYTKALGMELFTHSSPTSGGESTWVLGFRQGAKLKLRHRADERCRDAVYEPGENDLYWKIGITLADVDLARERLNTRGIEVTEPCQFHDIGYLCHLEDPDGYCIELLQHQFARNFVSVPALDGYPLGGVAMIGQVSINVTEIDKDLAFFQNQLGLRLLSRQAVPGRGFTLYFLADTGDMLPDPDVDAVENREWLWQRPYTVLELRSWDQKRPGLAISPDDSLGFRGVRFAQSGTALDLGRIVY